MKLNDFRLLVNDFPASFHFWHEVMGLPVVFRDENNTYAELEAGNVCLELLRADYFAYSAGAAAPPPAEQRGVIVFNVEDVDAAYADFVKRGAPSLAAPQDHPAGFARTALFSAPDGYVVEFFSSLNPMPHSS